MRPDEGYFIDIGREKLAKIAGKLPHSIARLRQAGHGKATRVGPSSGLGAYGVRGVFYSKQYSH